MRSQLLNRLRNRWKASEVVDAAGPEFIARTYAEHRDVRRYLCDVTARGAISEACDVGAGYGRMCWVLSEFAEKVVAFEREQSFVDKGAFLQPVVDFRRVSALTALPAPDDQFGMGLSFTVLQHLDDVTARKTIGEIQRVVRPNGHALLCEETDVSHQPGKQSATNRTSTHGRSVATYQAWMSPYTLVGSSPREIERGYPRTDVGTYMLFRAPA